MPRFEIAAKGPFSLDSSIRFLEGFSPAGYESAAAGHLHMAFVVDGTERVAGVCVRPRPSGVIGEVFGKAPADRVRTQVARILSLDVDGSGFPAIDRRDHVAGRLQARYPGLRPVCFWSPYEAAAWTIIGRRIRLRQAASIKARMAKELGPAVEVHGERVHAFPPPSALRKLKSFAGLGGPKIGWLHAVADSATSGLLDAKRLRSTPREQDLEELKSIPGIGDFSAELILLRGAGEPDSLPMHESRLRRAVARAYGLQGEPSNEELVAIAEPWRPYRTWVSLLLRASLEEERGEIGGTS